jgi:type I restriction enzyme S subunit
VLLERIREEKERLIKEGKIKRDKKEKTSDTSHYRKSKSITNDKLRITGEEMPFEIPESWVWVKLKDIFEINPKNDLNDEIMVSFIPMTLISDGFANKHTSGIKKWKEIKKGFTHFREGDVGIAKITPCFENRKSVVFQDLENSYGSGTTELHIFRPILEPFLSNYLIWFVKTESFIANGINYFTGAVGQQRVGKNIIEETYFPLPPLAEQHQIVATIESTFALIDGIEAGKQDLGRFIKQTKSKVLDLAIHGKLVPQDPYDEPASGLLERIRKEQKTKKLTADISHYPFEVPKSWIWTTLGEMFKIIMGQSPEGCSVTDNNQGIEFHQGKLCFGEKYLEKSNSYTNNPTKIADPNSLLLCVRAPVGIINITHRKVCIGRGLCAIQIPEDMDIIFAFHWLKTLEKSFNQKATGSTFTAISGDIIKNELLPLPPLAEQKRIVSKIEQIFTQLDEIESSIMNL